MRERTDDFRTMAKAGIDRAMAANEMTHLRVRESSASDPLPLSSGALDQLGQLGRKLAAQETWWGEVEKRARLKCDSRLSPLPNGQWRIKVDNAVGLFGAGPLQVARHDLMPSE